MTDLWQRFLFVDAKRTQRFNALAYPFVFATLVYGLGFATLGQWSGVNTSSLFQALSSLDPTLPVIWGLAAVLAAVLSMVLVVTRQGAYGRTAAMLGFCVWFFAGLTYLLNGYWLVLFTVAAPNIYFWTYFYVMAMQYKLT